MSSPEPPVPLKDHCSIIHDDVLYVYSPEAFLTLPLSENGTWTQEPNGVSVTGGVCVKGGLDGESSHPALYVVGGSTNSSTSNYSGVQRYSLLNKKWETIQPITSVTANRQNHGAAYMNASSAILIYGGSQNGDGGASTETFLMLMYPPYRVQAYSSIAPAAVKPILLPWNQDQVVMVGGGSNQKVFTFHPDPGWVDIGLSLPEAIPDSSVAQCHLQELDDGTKVLQTFRMAQSPNLVTRNVLQNAGYLPASYGEVIGEATSSAQTPTPTTRKRQVYQYNYPAYNDSAAPTESRTNFALASGNGDLLAVVGGDSAGSIALFNSLQNGWVDASEVFGDVQKPLTASVSSTATPTSTSSHTPAATTSASENDNEGQSNSLAILGGVLGGVGGLAAILIIILLWLRAVKKKRVAELRKTQQIQYPDDKTRDAGDSFDETGMRSLTAAAQPMGRSPVPSAALSEADSIAFFNKFNDKNFEANSGSHGGSKLNPSFNSSQNSAAAAIPAPAPVAHNRTKSGKAPLVISKPMNVNLGDYRDRPSIDLGAATPSVTSALPPTLPPVAVVSDRKQDQRKTDEGWAKYFQEEKFVGSPPLTADGSEYTRSSSGKPTGGGGFWPGSGVPESSPKDKTASKMALRDSEGNLLNQHKVTKASPNLHGPDNAQIRKLSVAEPAAAKFSSADSMSSDAESDYEDDRMDIYSDGIPDHMEHNSWTPFGSTWTGPPQRPVRPPSTSLGGQDHPRPPQTGYSVTTTNTSESGGSSIPAFPMPNATIRKVTPSADQGYTTTVQNPFAPGGHYRRPSSNYNTGPGHDYFGIQQSSPQLDRSKSTPSNHHQTASGKLPDNTDMSWINLGTPGQTALPQGPANQSQHHAHKYSVDHNSDPNQGPDAHA